MKAQFLQNDQSWSIDTEEPIDISILMISGADGPNCFFAPKFETNPVVAGEFIGDTSQGGLVNFYNVKINPHGNGTHTECVGHISKEKHKLRDCMQRYLFKCSLITVDPYKIDNGDKLITKDSINEGLSNIGFSEAMVIRSRPNKAEKLKQNYSGSNPIYFDPEAIEFLVSNGVNHLLTDLPSVDKEEDGGKLLSHRMFWGYPDKISLHRTITELIFVNEKVLDGHYIINIMIGDYDLDVSPSKPILYRVI